MRTLPLVALAALTLAAPAAAQQPTHSGVDLAAMDTTCKACQDFYQYANGNWLAHTTIPAAYSRWGTFNELADHNQEVLHTILDSLATADAPHGTNGQKVGTFYATCMDSAAADSNGAAPLAGELARIDSIGTKAELQEEVGRLQRYGVGVMFRFGGRADDKNSAQTIAVAGQGGLGLPDRDYYTKTDSNSVDIRNAYVAHIARTLELLGQPAMSAQLDAKNIMSLETQLAQASMTRVQQRDPNAVYHKMSLQRFQMTTPHFDWTAYLDDGGLIIDSLNVRQPKFFVALDGLVSEAPLSWWKAYLKWHLVSSEAPWLGEKFDQEAFSFQQQLTGAKEQLPRWKRCLQATDRGLGEALGQEYVQRAFPPAAKARALTMVHNLEAALKDRIQQLTWMSDTTKTRALAKLAAFTEKIGYPDKWRDYSALDVRNEPFVLNQMRARRFAVEYNLHKIGKPVDRTEWGMTPPTVNAYYNPTMNEIVFPAGILQPPFFDPNADDASNYGAMGAVIGHEMTHGFDDEGRQYGPKGNLEDWWTADDAKRYDVAAQRIIEQYDGYVAVDSVHLNGKLTEGENIADFGGLTVAYHALEHALEGKPHQIIDGFTPEQRFFLAWAKVWRQLQRPQMARMLVRVDPHSPGKWRVNGPLSDMPEFAKAFQCQAGDPMVRPDSLRPTIW